MFRAPAASVVCLIARSRTTPVGRLALCPLGLPDWSHLSASIVDRSTMADARLGKPTNSRAMPPARSRNFDLFSIEKARSRDRPRRPCTQFGGGIATFLCSAKDLICTRLQLCFHTIFGECHRLFSKTRTPQSRRVRRHQMRVSAPRNSREWTPQNMRSRPPNPIAVSFIRRITIAYQKSRKRAKKRCIYSQIRIW